MSGKRVYQYLGDGRYTGAKAGFKAWHCKRAVVAHMILKKTDEKGMGASQGDPLGPRGLPKGVQGRSAFAGDAAGNSQVYDS
jgi:hypothetical protein